MSRSKEDGNDDVACQKNRQAPRIATMDAPVRFRWFSAVLMGAFAIGAFEACTKDSGGAGSSGESPPSTAPATPTKSPEGVTASSGAGAAADFGVPISANKCPSAVPGSTTTVKELADGVEVTVIAPGGSPINDIRQRGVQIVAAAKDPATAGGSATDGLAKCPVVVKDATVTETDVPGGAAFTIKPVKTTGLADLKKEAKSRASSYLPEAVK
jgi:hypothetical protein